MSNKTEYFSIYPSELLLDGGAMFGIIPKPLWSKKIPADDLNRIRMNCRILYIKTKNRHILVDFGCGDYHDEKFNIRFGLQDTKTNINESLKKLTGITVDDITDLIPTHLHFDHVGGLGHIDGLTPLFKNATLHLNKDHYDYAQSPSPKDAGSFHHQYFNPIIDFYKKKNQVNWLNKNSILKDEDYELKFLTSHGHTPYQVLPYDEKMIYLGDLVPTAHHVHIPWVMGYDMQPGVSAYEKIDVYDFIIKNNLKVVFDHDIEHWGGVLNKKDEKKYEFSEVFKVKNPQYEKILEN